MLLPTPVLLLISTMLSFSAPVASIPVPAILSFRLQNLPPPLLPDTATLPLPGPTPLRIVDDSVETGPWLPLYPSNEEIEADSIFAPVNSATASKPKKTKNVKVAASATASGESATTSAAGSSTQKTSTPGKPYRRGDGKVLKSHTGCPNLTNSLPSSLLVSVSPHVFKESLCGRKLLVAQGKTFVKAFIAGKCDDCAVYDLGLDQELSDELKGDLVERSEVTGDGESSSLKWRML